MELGPLDEKEAILAKIDSPTNVLDRLSFTIGIL